MEEKLIRKIKGGMGAIKRGEKTKLEASLGTSFTSLKKLNIGMYDELMEEYKTLEDVKK